MERNLFGKLEGWKNKKKRKQSMKGACETEGADRHVHLYRYCVDIMGSQRRIFSGRADRKAWV